MCTLNGTKHVPLGYTRVLVNKTFVKTLVDSGNLFGTICSENLAKQLKLTVFPCSLTAGTAVAGQPVTILGRTKPFLICIENIDKPILIAPIVIKNLSHDLNLGEAFLRKQNASLKFNEGIVSMQIGTSSVKLVDKRVNLIRNSTDPRFEEIMRSDKAARQQRINNIDHVEISDSAFSIKTADKGIIKNNSLGFINVKSNISSGIGYFASKENSNFLNSNNLVALSGILILTMDVFYSQLLIWGRKM